MDHERRIATAIAEVQIGLEAYRAKLHSKNSLSDAQDDENLAAMQNEPHHPCYILAKFMRAAGDPRPSPAHTAHHIIPGKGKTPFTARARINLHNCDIRINDPANGVWMVRRRRDKGHWSAPHSNSHSEIHTHNYERWIFTCTFSKVTESAMRATLLRLRLLLESGKQPNKVTMPPDENWNGL